MSIFGPIYPINRVEQAVADTLSTWFNTYLREVELQNDMDGYGLEVPRSYAVRPDLDQFPEEMKPAVVIMSPGLAAPPTKEGDGTYTCKVRIGVIIFNQAPDRESVNMNSKLYAAAARAILIQKRSLGGIADSSMWEAEVYDEMPSDGQRSTGIAVLQFVFDIPGVVNQYGGPTQPGPPDPDTLPGSFWGTVETTDLEADILPEEDS